MNVPKTKTKYETFKYYWLFQNLWRHSRGESCSITRTGRSVMAIKRDGSHVEVGIAYCSPKDTFKKADGRKLAVARLDDPEAKFRFSFELQDESVFGQTFSAQLRVAFFEHVANTPGTPKWVKRAVQEGQVF
jgi:hypothetical protein